MGWGVQSQEGGPGKNAYMAPETFSGLSGQGILGPVYLAMVRKAGQSPQLESTLAPLVPRPAGKAKASVGVSQAVPSWLFSLENENKNSTYPLGPS